MRNIVPVTQIDQRTPEAGRIRLGVKTGKAMKSIDTLRFTSPYKDCIEILAAAHGGEVRQWSDAKASIQNQWEVITKAKEIEVFLPPDPLDQWYEMYGGSGLLRRCDGTTVTVPVQVGRDEYEPQESPCICDRTQQMECAPHTRIRFLIPNVPFRGVWRLETKGWNALHEVPGMVAMIQNLNQSGRMVRVALGVQQRTSMTPGGRKQHFVVPTITMLDSPEQILAGSADVRVLAAGQLPALPPGQEHHAAQDQQHDQHGHQHALPGTPSGVPADDDIVEAEIVLPEEEAVRQIANDLIIDPDRLWHGVWRQCNSDPTKDPIRRLRDAIMMMNAGEIEPIGFNADGSVIWKQ